MIFDLEIESAFLAVGLHAAVVVIAGTDGHGGVWDVGDEEHNFIAGVVQLCYLAVYIIDPCCHILHLPDKFGLLVAFELWDLVGCFVPPTFQLVGLIDQPPPFIVDRQELVYQLFWIVPVPQHLPYSFGIFPDD